MLGQPGPEPITEGAGPGRLLAMVLAALLLLGSGYWLWQNGAGTFSSSDPVQADQPAVAASAAAEAARAAAAATAAAVPVQTRSSYVVDGARIFSEQTITLLDGQLEALNVEAGPQVVVMSVPDLGNVTVEAYALRIANQWSIGDSSRADGVLLLVAPNDRKVRIEVGKGLQRTLTDAECKRLIDQVMVPLFRKGQYDAGVLAASQALITRLRANPTLPGRSAQ
ncbi:MAG: TPM domain-containing protein [Novosphingobium sp.]